MRRADLIRLVSVAHVLFIVPFLAFSQSFIFEEGFDDFDTDRRPPGWVFTGLESADVYTVSGYYGQAAPSLKFSDIGDQAVSRSFSSAESLSFWVRGVETQASTWLLVEEHYGGTVWKQVVELYGPFSTETKTYPLKASSTRVRFTYKRGPGKVAFDDVMVCLTTAPTPTPSSTPMPVPTPTPDEFTWFLPAGGTFINDFVFDTYVLVSNPNSVPAEVKFRFYDANGPQGSFDRTIAAGSRYTVKLNDLLGNNRPAVSTVVTSLNKVPVMVERSMYWSPGGVKWAGGHNTIGISEAAPAWYLPEGATHVFDQFVHILNPTVAKAEILVLFMNDQGASWTFSMTVGPERNLTLDVKSMIGSQNQVATMIRSLNNIPIAVERTMYWNSGGVEWIDGHASRGASSPAPVWHLAEGATHLFDYYVLVANPHPTDLSDVRFTFRVPGSAPVIRNVTLGALRRHTIKVNEIVGLAGEVWTTVETLNQRPVIAERAMYWSADGVKWAGGHGSIGSTGAALKWHLPEGATHIFDEYVLVANTSLTQTAQVRLRFMNETGAVWELIENIPPAERRTVNVNLVTGAQGQVSTTVESLNGVPVVAERSMYWNPGGIKWGSGHSSVGIAD